LYIRTNGRFAAGTFRLRGEEGYYRTKAGFALKAAGTAQGGLLQRKTVHRSIDNRAAEDAMSARYTVEKSGLL